MPLPDRPSDSDGEGTPLVVARLSSGPFVEQSRSRGIVVLVWGRCVMKDRSRHSHPPEGVRPLSALKQPRVQAVVRRLAQVDERRGLRDLCRCQGAALFNRAVDVSRDHRLHFLRLIRGDRAQPHRG